MHYLKRLIYSFSKKSLILSSFNSKLKCFYFRPNNLSIYCMSDSPNIRALGHFKNCLTHGVGLIKSQKLLNGNFRNFNLVIHRSFKTSEPRKLHPIVWLVFKPFLKLTAILSGRGFRKWWRNLPKDKKAYFLGILKANRRKLTVAFLITTMCSIGYYVNHIEETPITNRRRFIAFSPKQLEKINEFELCQLMHNLGDHIIPANHPATRRVEAVVNKILKANIDLDEVNNKKWGVSVIDNSIENAFVLPIGHVFVFTGMLKLCSNDDQLGTILAHEVAHCILNHGAENVSFSHLLDMISILIIAAIWAVLPSDSISLLTHWLYQKTVQILFQLPYNRKLETEADYVGLLLAAKACFDVRESSAFWSKMAILKKAFGDDPQIEFLSSHPNHESRSEYLDSVMEEALKVRKECNCPTLRYQDPRLEVEGVSKALEIARKQFLQHNPKPVVVLT